MQLLKAHDAVTQLNAQDGEAPMITLCQHYGHKSEIKEDALWNIISHTQNIDTVVHINDN